MNIKIGINIIITIGRYKIIMFKKIRTITFVALTKFLAADFIVYPTFQGLIIISFITGLDFFVIYIVIFE